MPALLAGDVIAIDFPGVTGTKGRPAVVLSSPIYHANRPDLIVGLLTSQISAATMQTDYLLRDWSQTRLRVASAFRCFITTLPPAANPTYIGRLSDRDWHEVSARINLAFALVAPESSDSE